MKQGNLFVLIYSPCFTKLVVVQLCIFLCYVNYCTLYENKSIVVCNAHLDFRGSICEKKCNYWRG